MPDRGMQELRSLAQEAEQRIDSGQLAAADEVLQEMWHAYDLCQKKNAPDCAGMATVLAGTSLCLGKVRCREHEFLFAAELVNDLRNLVEQHPVSEVVYSFASLMDSFLELKILLHDYNYLDDYVGELTALAEAFPDNRNIALACGACFGHLMTLFTYGGGPERYVRGILGALELFAGRFPREAGILSSYGRSLAAFCTDCKHAGKTEDYTACRSKLDAVLKSCTGVVAAKDMQEIKALIKKNGI